MSTSREGKTLGAELIYGIYEVDPLTCRRCGAQIKILAFIDAGSTLRD